MCRLIGMGACPHADQAQSSNWGIFNQHIWGDYDQHSQRALPFHVPAASASLNLVVKTPLSLSNIPKCARGDNFARGYSQKSIWLSCAFANRTGAAIELKERTEMAQTMRIRLIVSRNFRQGRRRRKQLAGAEAIKTWASVPQMSRERPPLSPLRSGPSQQ